jgi:hypothetical protein
MGDKNAPHIKCSLFVLSCAASRASFARFSQ